jgi:hypothetical protein
MLERYLIPLAPYVLVALLAVVGLAVFLSYDREIRRLKSRLRGKSPDLLNPSVLKHSEFESRLEDLAGLLRETENRANAAAQPGVIRPSLNMNRRNQVIRLSRRGQAAANIAATLSMPRKEVELLLKIHNLSLENASGPKA